MGEGRRRLKTSRERTAKEEEGEGKGDTVGERIRWKGERDTWRVDKGREGEGVHHRPPSLFCLITLAQTGEKGGSTPRQFLYLLLHLPFYHPGVPSTNYIRTLTDDNPSISTHFNTPDRVNATLEKA